MAAPGFNFNWPKVPSEPPMPKHTIEQEIRNYASTHSAAGTMRLFLKFMATTRAFIFMSGVKRTATPSQGALSALGTMIEAASKKRTVEAVMEALFEALAYLKLNYQYLFPGNRRIGAYDPKAGTLGASSLVDPDDFFIAKWRKIAEGGDYEKFGSEQEKRLAKLQFDGGRRTARRKATRRRRNTMRRRRSMRN